MMRSDVQDIVTLHRKGMTAQQIAGQVGRNHETVARTLRSCGFPISRSYGNQLRRSGRVWLTYSTRARILELRRLGWSIRRIARDLNCPHGSITSLIPEEKPGQVLAMRRMWHDPSTTKGARRLERILLLAQQRCVDRKGVTAICRETGEDRSVLQGYTSTPLFRARVALFYNGANQSMGEAAKPHYRAMFWEQGIPADWIAARFDVPLKHVLKVVHGRGTVSARGRKGE